MEYRILSFEKPKKIHSTEEHNRMHSSDSGIEGTYVPNMSRNDMEKWKAKHIKGENERVEIRKTMHGIQLLIVVFRREKEETIHSFYGSYKKVDHRNVRISANGKIDMTWRDYQEMQGAILEAMDTLKVI